MKFATILINSLMCMAFMFSVAYNQENIGPKKIIYETDMCLDVDDVGALAILHAMANMGEVEILAVSFNEEHPNGPGTIDAINTWYGRGDIPIGIYKGNLDNDWSSNSNYLSYIDNNFPNDINNTNADSAVSVYRQILSEQPDSSVTVISVGFMNNLYDLLQAEPELIEQKVVELVIMAGVQNDGFNFVMHNLVDVSEYVLENWPTPIVISQHGGDVYTGENLSTAPMESPVRWSYYKWFNNSFQGRSSWDQLAVLYGVRGLSTYFTNITSGTGSLSNGYSYPMVAGWRSYLGTKISNSSFEGIIEDLMDVLPAGIPLVSITSPENNETFEVGADITIEANATDSDGLVKKVGFFSNTVKFAEDSIAPYSVVLENVNAGIYHLKAVVSDDENKTSLSKEVKIYVGELDFDFVGHWEFENDVMDASDYGNNGNISGTPEFVDGKMGKALEFNSNNDYVTVQSSSDYNLTSFSISVWVKIPQSIPSGWRTIIEHNRWGANWFGLWKSSNANTFHFRWGNDASSDFSSTISADNWYLVTATFDANQRIAKLYLNGELDKTIQNTDVPSPEIGRLTIGINYDGDENFMGVIDDLRIYNRVLDLSEIEILATVTSLDNSIENESYLTPKKFDLSNYPNPFNPSTTISYSIPTYSHVTIDVFDMKGNKLNTLVNSRMNAGNYTIQFDAKTFASGIYFYRIKAGKYETTKKMILTK